MSECNFGFSDIGSGHPRLTQWPLLTDGHHSENHSEVHRGRVGRPHPHAFPSATAFGATRLTREPALCLDFRIASACCRTSRMACERNGQMGAGSRRASREYERSYPARGASSRPLSCGERTQVVGACCDSDIQRPQVYPRGFTGRTRGEGGKRRGWISE